MKENHKVSVSSNVLVAAGKSSRLAALSKKAMGQKNITGLGNNKSQHQFVADLKPETEKALQQSIQLIEEKVAFILNGYPMGKKSTFFKLKHGVGIDKIKEMAMRDVFVLLGLETIKIQQFRLIENLDSSGNDMH
jgi:dGTP triphosphohydrolase